jgi:hypothetical protein
MYCLKKLESKNNIIERKLNEEYKPKSLFKKSFKSGTLSSNDIFLNQKLNTKIQNIDMLNNKSENNNFIF